jgi:hypothetical protein
VRKSLVFFCFPHGLSGGFNVGGDWRLTVVVGCGVRGFGVSIGGSSINEVILVGFLCVMLDSYVVFFSPATSTP